MTKDLSQSNVCRRTHIGGSDARVIMDSDEAALHRLWREKRGEIDHEDLSQNLAVQLGGATENLNRRWFEQETQRLVGSVQHFQRHPSLSWMGATLDGLVADEGAVFEAKFMLPWYFSEEGAAEKYMAQLQHNMLVTASRRAYLSIITGGAKWVLIEVDADPVYQTVLVQVERLFWRCVQTGELPGLFDAAPPSAKLAAVRVVDMTCSEAWASHAESFVYTLAAYGQHERAKAQLKALMPKDAREAYGHGVVAKRSKVGSINIHGVPKGGSRAELE
jgi:predicted phage-related endonuclease